MLMSKEIGYGAELSLYETAAVGDGEAGEGEYRGATAVGITKNRPYPSYREDRGATYSILLPNFNERTKEKKKRNAPNNAFLSRWEIANRSTEDVGSFCGGWNESGIEKKKKREN
jgi:hypothetical protein